MSISAIHKRHFLFQLNSVDESIREALEITPLAPVQDAVDGAYRRSIGIAYDESELGEEFVRKTLNEFKEKRHPYLELYFSKSENTSGCSFLFWVKDRPSRV